jgi:hypothetical protein
MTEMAVGAVLLLMSSPPVPVYMASIEACSEALVRYEAGEQNRPAALCLPDFMMVDEDGWE